MKIIILTFAALMLGTHLISVNAQAPPPADPQMQAVLDQLKALKPKPIEKLTPAEAREQPNPTTAVKALLKKKNITPVSNLAKVEDSEMPGGAGKIPVRIYTPNGEGPFPVVVYIHGGGWVIASNDVYDASPRAIAEMANDVVVSIEYRKAPEHKFPAAHEDSYAVLQYVMKNAASINGDPRKVAIMGESAGGNMAAAACMMARDRKGVMPIYQVLVYPVADGDMKHQSYKTNKNAKPLNSAMIGWFAKYTLPSKKDAMNPYFGINKGNVKGVPPATIIAAEIDPLLTEGQLYSNKLKKAGIPVRYRLYKGVTHEFFGMGAAVKKAKDAEMFAAEGLKSAFSK